MLKIGYFCWLSMVTMHDLYVKKTQSVQYLLYQQSRKINDWKISRKMWKVEVPAKYDVNVLLSHGNGVGNAPKTFQPKGCWISYVRSTLIVVKALGFWRFQSHSHLICTPTLLSLSRHDALFSNWVASWLCIQQFTNRRWLWDHQRTSYVHL